MSQDTINKLKHLNILIVDDNKNYLYKLSKGLQSIFKTISTASTFNKAVEEMKKNLILHCWT